MHILLLGDQMVGKTALTLAASTKKVPDKYTSTQKTALVKADNGIQFIDTPGLRHAGVNIWLGDMKAGSIDAVIIVTSQTKKLSFAKESAKFWYDIAQSIAPGKPIIVCDNKSDLRSDKGEPRAVELGKIVKSRCFSTSAKDGDVAPALSWLITATRDNCGTGCVLC